MGEVRVNGLIPMRMHPDISMDTEEIPVYESELVEIGTLNKVLKILWFTGCVP